MKFESVVIFKPNHKIKIIIWSIFLIGVFVLKQFNRLDDIMIYGLGSLALFLLLMEIYKQTQYDFILKIDKEILSYKNDKKIIKLKEIQDFHTLPQMYNLPPRLMITINGKTEAIQLENFNKSKMSRISEVLSERIGQLN